VNAYERNDYEWYDNLHKWLDENDSLLPMRRKPMERFLLAINS
jgi:hypothetical protein